MLEFNMDSQEFEITEVWLKARLLDTGYLSDQNTTSEYERGFIDCWNELRKFIPNHIKISARYI